MANDSDALIIVDLQNDFCPGGALAVAGGDDIVEPINRLQPRFSHVFTSQDWHPADHCSFESQGGPWPPHCVQNTRGAELHPRLKQDRVCVRIRKGQKAGRDAYSAFQETPLEEELSKRGVRRVFVVGLATDYCVKQTALDALRLGFKTVVLTDLVRAVNLRPDDGKRALEEIRRRGGELRDSSAIVSRSRGSKGSSMWPGV